MKKEIHPNYTELAVTCSCGHSFKTASTLAEASLHVEVCSKCHPFFTGKQKLVDTSGRVDRFNQKFKQKNFGARTIKREEASDNKAA